MIPDWVFWIIGLFFIWKILELILAKYITDKVMNYIREHPEKVKVKDK